ncbi:MAG: polyprenyl synthetase family protein [Pirellulales bacterium]|nr:polyprenyl synthetase family protein [Pirellulales bacterium]
MSTTGQRRATVPDKLRVLYEPVARELEAVERLLQREFSNEDSFVDRLAQHGFRLGGKRLRPALVLLSAGACGGVRPEHFSLAVTTELIHTATLIHDDVLDEATMRRHLDTVNARWDNEASILLGDYFLARVMCLVSSLDDNFACRTIGETAREMCEGELRQIESRGDYDLGEDDYFRIIAGKTAMLMACCCRLGAHYAGAEPALGDALARYGRNLGVAFQIADDVLDLTGDERAVGKSLGTDLLKQKATLPLIRLLATVERKDRERLTSALSNGQNHHRDLLRPWLQRGDAISYAQNRARSFTAQASAELDLLPDSPFKRSLVGLTDFVIERRQ